MRTASSLALLLLFTACDPSERAPDDPGGDAAPPGMVDAAPPACGEACANHCPEGTATYLEGVILTPNGVDPVPGASVYVPLALQSFPAGVACEICGDQISNAAVLSRTRPDGTFRLGPIPTAVSPVPGTTIDVVAQKGRFRRVTKVAIQSWCADNMAADISFVLPGRQEDNLNTIPKIAVVTGTADAMECVLAKLGLENGAFDIYAGAPLESNPLEHMLFKDPALLGSYNIVFLNCGNQYEYELLIDPQVRANLEAYVKAGGRVYATDQAYDFVEQVPGWAGYIDFGPAPSGATSENFDAAQLGDDGITTEGLVHDPTMAAWLQAVEQRTGQAIIDASSRVHIEGFKGGWAMQLAVPTSGSTRTWISGPVTGFGLSGDLPLTTTIDVDSCGRVLFSSYHTLGRTVQPLPFPSYCSSAALSPQERVLEYLILHAADCIE